LVHDTEASTATQDSTDFNNSLKMKCENEKVALHVKDNNDVSLKRSLSDFSNSGISASASSSKICRADCFLGHKILCSLDKVALSVLANKHWLCWHSFQTKALLSSRNEIASTALYVRSNDSTDMKAYTHHLSTTNIEHHFCEAFYGKWYDGDQKECI
jgi:hypothetical protein